jgi:uncharacterized membrane protein YfcA
MDALFITTLFVCGLIIGLVAAIFGIGGAIVAIPLFRILLGFPGNVAIATALPLTIPTALSGAIHFSKYGLIKYKTAIFGGVIGIAFSIFGAFLTQYFSSEFLMLCFGFLLFLMAFISYKIGDDETQVELISIKEKAIITAFIGAVVGFVSGFLGIGGGALLVPLLIWLRKVSIKKAVATSLFMIAIYAIPGALTHYFLGNIELSVLAVVLIGAVAGTRLGAGIAIRIEKNKHRKLLAAVLVILGIVVIFNELFS